MKIKLIYPSPLPGKRRWRATLRTTAQWPFLLAAYLCPILNLVLGGPAWSLIVLWGLWIVWSFVFAPVLVEYNRISQTIKLLADACVLLLLIDGLLAPGWAVQVTALVCLGGLLLSALLFFSDLERQKQNMLPLILLIAVSILYAALGLLLWGPDSGWALPVTGALALALLLACLLVLGEDFRRELRKRFHVQ